MLKSLIADAAKLRRDEQGTVTMLFGLTAVVMCMSAALALDVGRAIAAKSKVAAAADAAALAAAKAIRLEGQTDDQAIAIAKRVAEENMRLAAGKWTTVHDIVVTIDRTRILAQVDIRSSVPTILAGLAGFAAFNAPGTAAAMVEDRDFEVSLQLDLTGSMCDAGPAPCTDHPKIQGLKNATKDLVEILLPDNRNTAQRIRIAYAPFTAGVNLGPYQADVTGNRTTANGCVYERKDNTRQATDVEPIGEDRFMVAADLQAPPHNVANPRRCPASSVVPLTDDKRLLLDTVDAFVADGYTGGHNGTAWAWNMISPSFQNVWPDTGRPTAYNDGRTDKVAVLMTDGEYNTMHGRGWNANQVSGKAVDTCNAMKTAGIKVYTVGFALGGNQTAIDTLAACATSPSHFKQAATPAELQQAFRSIANDIVWLRLTN
jgi:hypothetical protein